MNAFSLFDHLRFIVNRLKERLWVRPLAVCLISVAVVFAAKLADGLSLRNLVPTIAQDSIETLLSLLAASMLVIATFSVASMVSAYASASSSATPRSFRLVLSDDVSQNALSTFVGAFIFSVVALTAVKNDFYGRAGLFVLFAFTGFVFALVILTFVRWVDSIARLGRIGSTIDKVEFAATAALTRRRDMPTLNGIPVSRAPSSGQPVYASRVGYVQHLNAAQLQQWAEEIDAHVVIVALPGTFVSPGQVLAYVNLSAECSRDPDLKYVVESFQIDNDRTFEDDPRFGLIVLSEIAGRALSPSVNDPGTAIKVIGTLVRLLALWTEPDQSAETKGPEFDRVAVPEISTQDLFDDAFTAIARDGAGSVEVVVRLIKALNALESHGNDDMKKAAVYHRDLAVARARNALSMEADLAAVERVANVAQTTTSSATPAESTRER